MTWLSRSTEKTKSDVNLLKRLADKGGLPQLGPSDREVLLQVAAGPRRAYAKLTARGLPDSLRLDYLNAMAGRASSDMAIKMACLECVDFEAGARGRCDHQTCPLWPYRERVDGAATSL